MNLRQRKKIDLLLGGSLVALLKPFVFLTGFLLRRDHEKSVRGRIVFIKMLGGGSLVIALPALLGIRKRYPNSQISLICTASIKPFADSLKIFDHILVIDDSTLARCFLTGLLALRKSFGADTVIDLEVYSRLTTVLSVLTCARNRIGFYLESTFWRRQIHTHLFFFNRFSGSYYFYEQIAVHLGAMPSNFSEIRQYLVKEHGLSQSRTPRLFHVLTIGPGCSDLAKERMLSIDQWAGIFKSRIVSPKKVVVKILGSTQEQEFAQSLSRVIREKFGVHCEDLTGRLTLQESIEVLWDSDEYWGIDSALVHYARLFGIKTKSWWGPTDPMTLLKQIEGLEEEVFYQKIPCSPCVHNAEEPPCAGNNLCIKKLLSEEDSQMTEKGAYWIVKQ